MKYLVLAAIIAYAYYWRTYLRPRTLAGRLDALRDPYREPFDHYGVHFRRSPSDWPITPTTWSIRNIRVN
jgi:hypothetical protein